MVSSRIASVLCLPAWLAGSAVFAALPQEVTRAFHDAQIPLSAVGAWAQEVGAPLPVFSQHPAKPMNPASTMKLVTTFAALELLGPGYRWRTEAYADGPIAEGGA